MWAIEYYSEQIQQAIQILPTGLRACYVHLTSLMIEFGANWGMPHTRAMGDGLFELCLKGKEGIARVVLLYAGWTSHYYATRIHQEIPKDTSQGD